MPGTCPKSHVASGWIGFEMGTSSRWHHERVPHLSPCVNAPPSAPAPMGGQRPPPPHPHVEDSLLKRRTSTFTGKYPRIPPSPPPHYCGSVSGGQFPRTVIQSVPVPSHWPTLGAATGEAPGGAPTRGRGGTWGPAPLPQTMGTVGQGCVKQPGTTGGGGSHTPRPPPPQPTHPTAPPPPPPPLKVFGRIYLLPSAGVIIYSAPSAPLRTLHHLGGGGGVAGPPPPPRKKAVPWGIAPESCGADVPGYPSPRQVLGSSGSVFWGGRGGRVGLRVAM